MDTSREEETIQGHELETTEEVVSDLKKEKWKKWKAKKPWLISDTMSTQEENLAQLTGWAQAHSERRSPAFW